MNLASPTCSRSGSKSSAAPLSGCADARIASTASAVTVGIVKAFNWSSQLPAFLFRRPFVPGRIWHAVGALRDLADHKLPDRWWAGNLHTTGRLRGTVLVFCRK